MSRKDLHSLEEKMEHAKRLVEFGHKIQILRIEKGLSLEEVGQALDVSRNYISELERGKKTPSDLMVREIAKFFILDEGELFNIIGKIPLSTREALEESPNMQRVLSDLKERHEKGKLTKEQMQEIYEEMISVYERFLDDKS